MIEAGEDPRFIARRLIVHASEDIGMADPTALQTAVAAAQAVEFVGMPEARINLAQAVIHLSLAPKSNAVITAVDAALADVRKGLAGPVPGAPARRALQGRGEDRARAGLQVRPRPSRRGGRAAVRTGPVDGREYYSADQTRRRARFAEALAGIRAVLRGTAGRR